MPIIHVTTVLRGAMQTAAISVVRRNAHEDGTSIHIVAFSYLNLSLSDMKFPPDFIYYYNKSQLEFSLTLLAPELFFSILVHPVYKM